DVPVDRVLGDWTEELERELDAVQLFDLSAGPSIYRVFLLPGCLQVDVSFTPAGRFGARGPRFQLLFGEAVENAPAVPPPSEELVGWGAHHAVRARLAVERGRYRQAEYWIGDLRNVALSLACRRRGLESQYGRGLDRLPEDVLARFDEGRPKSAARA